MGGEVQDKPMHLMKAGVRRGGFALMCETARPKISPSADEKIATLKRALAEHGRTRSVATKAKGRARRKDALAAAPAKSALIVDSMHLPRQSQGFLFSAARREKRYGPKKASKRYWTGTTDQG
jgi:hypothetical protein